jgi:hypothetical protein
LHALLLEIVDGKGKQVFKYLTVQTMKNRLTLYEKLTPFWMDKDGGGDIENNEGNGDARDDLNQREYATENLAKYISYNVKTLLKMLPKAKEDSQVEEEKDKENAEQLKAQKNFFRDVALNEVAKEPKKRAALKSPPVNDRMGDINAIMEAFKVKAANREEDKKRKAEEAKLAEEHEQKEKERKENMDMMVQSMTTIVTPLAEVLLQGQALARAETAQARDSAQAQSQAMLLAFTSIGEAIKQSLAK